VAGLVTGDSIVNPDAMFEKAGIDLIVDRAEQVDAIAKKVTLSSGGEVSYHKLVLGTGSSPVIPPIDGHDLEGVFTLRSLRHAEAIRRFLDETGARKLAFIGAGFVSLEVASLLLGANPAFEITVVELLDRPLPLMLDPEIAARIADYLVEQGLTMRTGRKVTRVLGRNGRVTGVELDGGETIDADLVFLNVGARPDLELAQAIGLEMGQFGIKVDRFLTTSDPDIIAAGDAIENIHFVTGKPAPIQLRGPAVIQGRLAAKVLAGHRIEFPGVLGNSAVKLFDKSIAATGLTEEQARREGFETVCATVDSRSKHGMIPGVKPWTLKLVFDARTTRLLGGQIVSDAEAPVKEIDAINALILGGKTVADLSVLMTAGNPDCSSEPSAEPITIAAEQALQKLGGAG
jgi:NADPH-dependent 2,4-dienoyl-CoA reductase/sulfur reductase-like enzyme